MRVLKGAEVSAKIKEEVQAALEKCNGAAPKEKCNTNIG